MGVQGQEEDIGMLIEPAFYCRGFFGLTFSTGGEYNMSSGFR